MFIAHPLLEAAAPVPSARSFHMTHLTSGSLATDYLHGLLPRGSGKEFACQAEDVGLISGSERSPGEGSGNPCQYSCLGNPMDIGALWATVHGMAELDMT